MTGRNLVTFLVNAHYAKEYKPMSLVHALVTANVPKTAHCLPRDLVPVVRSEPTPEVDPFAFVVDTDWDGCPILGPDAPDVCENV